MRRGKGRPLAAILLALLGACIPENASGPQVPDFYVWCVLVEGHPAQFALVDRVYRPDEPAGDGIRGAEVKITWEGGQVRFFETLLVDTLWEEGERQLDTLMWGYMDTTALEWLRPGRTYHLTVRLPGGHQVEGSTTLPGDFRILSPAPYDTLRVPSDRPLVWTHAEGAVFSVVYIQGPFPDTLLSLSSPLPEDFREALTFSLDTTSQVLGQVFYFPQEGWYRIEVRPENRDLYLWNAFAEGNLSGDVPVIGVFGGMVTRHLWLYITR